MRMRSLVAILAGLLTAVSSCSEPTVSRAAPLAVSFSATTATPTQSLGAVAAAGDLVLTIGGHTLDLQQVQLTIDRAELERNRGVGCLRDDDDDEADEGDDDGDECEDVRIGLSTVDLPLAGGLVTLDQTAIPAGTYREIELRISQVRLRGVFDGQAFDATVPVRVDKEIELSPPLVVVEGTPAAITVNAAVATWLINVDGSLIDPRKLAGSSTLQAIVRSRIAGSFHAFEDRDRDGDDDNREGSNRDHD